MGFYISIKKEFESDAFVVYTFADPESEVGKLKIDKATGSVTLLQPAPNDPVGSRYQRASRKIWKHWQNGKYPDVTCWAS